MVGALLFSSQQALSLEEIRTCLNETAQAHPEHEIAQLLAEASPREIAAVVEDIVKELRRLGLGLELVERSGGFRFQTQPGCGLWVRKLLKADRPRSLSRPALETLAIIANRQPITKAEVEAVRGVMVDHIIKSLMELHLVRIVGRSELPGRPFLYGTTSTFLNHFGLSNLKELNDLDPTLQRSRPAERKALYKRPKAHKSQDGGEEAKQETLALDDKIAPQAEDPPSGLQVPKSTE